jgi:hypothetical protein
MEQGPSEKKALDPRFCLLMRKIGQRYIAPPERDVKSSRLKSY